MSALAIIAAVARNGVIGRDGALPWHLPEDLAHFRRVTAGCAVIMGRRTWESLPSRFRPLPGRHNIVVTRRPDWRPDGATVAADLDAAIAAAGDAPRAFVIGGARLFAAALPRARELLLTEIDADAGGDVRFPAWPRSDFVEVGREHHRSADGVGFDFVSYRRS